MDDLLQLARTHDAACSRALFEVPCRRGGARRGRLRSMAAATSRTRPTRRALCAEAGAIAAMVAAGEQAHPRMRGDRAGAGSHHALRRLPPEAARVRGRRPADPSLRPRRPASHRDPGPAPADVLRPAPSRRSHDRARSLRQGAGLQAQGRGGPGLGPGRLRRRGEAGRDHPLWRAAGLPADRRCGSHAGRLVLGHVGPTPVAVLQGRAHYYERGQADEMQRRHPRRGRARLRDAAADQRRRQPAARHAAGLGDGDHRPHQLHRRQSAVRRSAGRQPLRRHGRCLRSGAARAAAGGGARGQCPLPRRRLHLVQRAELRDAGRDPRRPRAGRRRRRHVDRARDDPGAPCRHEGRGAVADDQLRRRPGAGRARPRADAGRGQRAASARRAAAVAALPRSATLEPHAAAGDHPQEARRPGAVGRGDRLRRPRHHTTAA